jgi:cytoskeletal protein RodZ
MAYKILLFFLIERRLLYLKELGQKLRESREKNGVTVEEAAADLNLRPSQIENIEEGNVKAFKDVFYLKYFIRDYAKYLGLDYEKLVEQFNDFLFDYTSKIPLDDIKRVSKEKKEQKKIISPYTISKKKKVYLSPMYIYIIIGILVLLSIYFLIKSFGNDEFKTEQTSDNAYIEIMEG